MTMREKLSALTKISCPVRFEPENKNFIIEIQYFVIPEQKIKSENGNSFLVFAVTTDGWELLFDTDFNSDNILQKEMNDIDFLDITIDELLESNQVQL